jgi:hypothetical protein
MLTLCPDSWAKPVIEEKTHHKTATAGRSFIMSSKARISKRNCKENWADWESTGGVAEGKVKNRRHASRSNRLSMSHLEFPCSWENLGH